MDVVDSLGSEKKPKLAKRYPSWHLDAVCQAVELLGVSIMVEFNTQCCDFPDPQRTIGSGLHVDDAYFRSALNWYVGRKPPDWLIEYIDRTEQSDPVKRRGRRAMDVVTRSCINMYTQCYYRGTLDWLQARKRSYRRVAGLGTARRKRVRSDHSAYVLAAMIAAKRMSYGRGSWRSILNLKQGRPGSISI
jgi:hypothetical protein